MLFPLCLICWMQYLDDDASCILHPDSLKTSLKTFFLKLINQLEPHVKAGLVTQSQLRTL